MRVLRWLIGMALVILLIFAIYYSSRYWGFRFWGREGLLGIEYLRPQGDLVSRSLRQTPGAPYDIVLWALGWFAVLSLGQKVWGWIFRD